MLGYSSAVVTRVRAAEETAAAEADASPDPSAGPSTAVVLADRALIVRRQADQAYPRTRKARLTYTGSGYQSGYREGQKADIGSTKLQPTGAKPLGPGG